MTYYRREWLESRGDQFDSWGTSVWLFEVDADGYPVKQLELYEVGYALKYDAAHAADDLGGLGDQPPDPADFGPFEIEETVFMAEWAAHVAYNRQA